MKNGRFLARPLTRATGHAPVVLVIFGAVLAACADADEGAETADVASALEARAAEDIEARRARIREHFAERLSQLNIVATTRTERGTIIDWIPRPENLELPPPSSEPGFELETGEALARSPLETQAEARGPDGTVPVVRFDVESYLATVGDDVPEDPYYTQPADPAPEANGRYYAFWRAQRKTNGEYFYAAKASLNLWNVPDLAVTGPAGDHSIVQTAVAKGTGSGTQTVEAGSIQWFGWNGGDPTLFVFFTTNNYTSRGDWLGGYNSAQNGWCQLSSIWVPGMEFVDTSVTDGTQIVAHFRTELWSGNWYVYVNGETIGYYPERRKNASCNTTYTSYLFATSGLRNNASQATFYGEVFDEAAPNATDTDMGSGVAAAYGHGKAAYVRTVLVWPGDEISYIPMHSLDANLSTGVTDAYCYTMSTPEDLGGSTVNRFFFGGEGDEWTYCGP